jgi:hypothetical protein
MARRRARTRTRSGRQSANDVRTASRGGLVGGVDASVIPRVLVGAVNGVEIVAVSALQLARDVLLSGVSGAASIGAEALTATTAGARGVVSAASRMVGDIAGTAVGTFQEAVNNARRSRLGVTRPMLMRPARSLADGRNERATPTRSTPARRPLRRARRQRAAAGPAGMRVAA